MASMSEPTWTAFGRKRDTSLKENANKIAVLKLRRDEPLTQTDLAELERIFVASGADPAQIEAVRSEGGLGLFVRSLVGLDREAAKKAFADFLAARKPSADQIEFVNMIVDHLTDRGVMEPRLLYESPFTDINPLGVEGIFGQKERPRSFRSSTASIGEPPRSGRGALAPSNGGVARSDAAAGKNRRLSC